MRQSSGVTWTFAGLHGNTQLAVNDATGAVSRERYLPFGQRRGDDDQAVIVRVVDYTVPDRKGDHIRLITTILDPAEAAAQQLAASYRERWEAETGSLS